MGSEQSSALLILSIVLTRSLDHHHCRKEDGNILLLLLLHLNPDPIPGLTSKFFSKKSKHCSQHSSPLGRQNLYIHFPVLIPIKSIETHNYVCFLGGWTMKSLVLFYSTMPDKPAVEFTLSKRGCILALRDKKYSYHDIALKVGDFTASAMWKNVQQELKHHT